MADELKVDITGMLRDQECIDQNWDQHTSALWDSKSWLPVISARFVQIDFWIEDERKKLENGALKFCVLCDGCIAESIHNDGNPSKVVQRAAKF